MAGKIMVDALLDQLIAFAKEGEQAAMKNSNSSQHSVDEVQEAFWRGKARGYQSMIDHLEGWRATQKMYATKEQGGG